MTQILYPQMFIYSPPIYGNVENIHQYMGMLKTFRFEILIIIFLNFSVINTIKGNIDIRQRLEISSFETVEENNISKQITHSQYSLIQKY